MAVMVELQRLAALDPDWDWSRCAVMAREWKYLDPVRAFCEAEGIPAQTRRRREPRVLAPSGDAGPRQVDS